MTTANLYSKLKQAKSEEDVKDAYIKALGLKSFTKGLVDIRTKEIWFEAKDGRHTLFFMFTQLLNYVQDARNKGEEIPPFLAVIDSEKAAIMKTADVLPFLDKKTIKWGKSASNVTKEALANDTPNTISFDNFDKAYKKLTEKLQPQVYEFGFLRDSEKLTEMDVEILES